MSKIALQGNASGTATFTLAAPATNTNRTLTLPDAAGTIPVKSGSYISTSDLGSGTPSSSSFLRGDQTWASLDFTSSLSSSGYQKLPSGLYIQWGVTTANAAAVSFPIAFPNAVFVAVGTPSSAPSVDNIVLNTLSTTQIRFTQVNGSPTVYYIAIGY